MLPIAGLTAAVAAERPRVKDVTFDPAVPETGGKLKVRMKLEHAVRADLKWYVNDTEVQSDSYDGIADGVELKETLKTGDGVEVRITPYDSEARSGAEMSSRTKVVKAPPSIKKTSEKLDAKAKKYSAKIEATDPDKDKISYKIEGPAGMTIDDQGNITWDVSQVKDGRWPVKVTAQDSHGSQAVLSWSVGIKWEKGK